MSGRRHHLRFTPPPTWEGLLRVLHDVVIAQRTEDGKLTVISGEPGIVGELLWLDLADKDGDADVKVRVLDSRPVVVRGALRYRLELDVVRTPDSKRFLGVLTREIPVRMRDFSHCGCLLESRRRMNVGAVGTVRLEIGGRRYVEDVQVVRCQSVKGAGSLYHVGVRFLWTSPSRQRSLCRALGRDVGKVPVWLTASALEPGDAG